MENDALCDVKRSLKYSPGMEKSMRFFQELYVLTLTCVVKI